MLAPQQRARTRNIKEKFGVIHLSTGDMLRAAVKGQTELGLMAKNFMDAGQLVPDSLIIDVICDRLKEGDCEEGCWMVFLGRRHKPRL